MEEAAQWFPALQANCDKTGIYEERLNYALESEKLGNRGEIRKTVHTNKAQGRVRK